MYRLAKRCSSFETIGESLSNAARSPLLQAKSKCVTSSLGGVVISTPAFSCVPGPYLTTRLDVLTVKARTDSQGAHRVLHRLCRFPAIGERAHRPPKTGTPYKKEEVLAYWKMRLSIPKIPSGSKS